MRHSVELTGVVEWGRASRRSRLGGAEAARGAFAEHAATMPHITRTKIIFINGNVAEWSKALHSSL